jgi:hypothetical protein
MKTLIKILIVVVVGLVCGCGYDIESWHINEAQDKCEEHDGVYNISGYVTNPDFIQVKCDDGSVFKIYRKRLKD